MDRNAALAGVVALVALAAPHAAEAQDAATRARQLFEQGVAAMDGGNPALASQYFQQSYSLFARASTACNMALSLERSGRQCDAEDWYRQCAALDQEGRFRDHANRQAAAIAAQCPSNAQPTHNPFVSGPQGGGGATASGGGGVQIVDQGAPATQPMYRPSPSHALLGVGIAGLVLGAGGFVGGWAASEQAWAAHRELQRLQPGGGNIVEGTAAADAYYEARTFTNVSIGLYVAGGVFSALGVTLIIIDLAQPGVFGGSAEGPSPVRFTLGPTPGGAFGRLQLAF